tara:strand:- start:743 stop:946 length:204 start_codon:yes stop_codon:yes gene_type:complete
VFPFPPFIIVPFLFFEFFSQKRRRFCVSDTVSYPKKVPGTFSVSRMVTGFVFFKKEKVLKGTGNLLF